MHLDETEKKLRDDIISYFSPGDWVSIPLIQRKLRTGYIISQKVFDFMVENKDLKRDGKIFRIS